MEESRVEEVSGSLATAEDIRKRLIRPFSHRSQPPSSSIASHRYSNSPKFEGALNCVANESLRLNRKLSQNSPKFEIQPSKKQKRNRDVKEVTRLEDYLNPFLLSTIRAKIFGKKKMYGGYGVGIKNAAAKDEDNDFDRFERCGDYRRLNFSADGSRAKPEESNDVVDLKSDCDSFGVGVDEGEDLLCSPFQQFERNALKRFQC